MNWLKVSVHWYRVSIEFLLLDLQPTSFLLALKQRSFLVLVFQPRPSRFCFFFASVKIITIQLIIIIISMNQSKTFMSCKRPLGGHVISRGDDRRWTQEENKCGADFSFFFDGGAQGLFVVSLYPPLYTFFVSGVNARSWGSSDGVRLPGRRGWIKWSAGCLRSLCERLLMERQ